MNTKNDKGSFELGDVVRLKSSGPSMTVVCLPESGQSYHCAWFIVGQVQHGSFPAECLEPTQPDRFE